ncbi:MAG: amino acid adenylation domain-containing protein [Pyrinomonadaceae bacterium]
MKNVSDVYPLSPLQQGLFFHSLYARRTGVYFEQMRCRLAGDLDVPAFKSAWQRVIERHAIFRTAFVWEGLDEPLQVVRRRAELPWQEEDLTGLPAAEREGRLLDFLQSDRALGFDLARPPLMRAALMRTDAGSHEFVWSHHHLIMDGWSLSLLLKEVFSFYEAFNRGVESRPEPARPYRDYIAWLLRQDQSKAEQFWRETLKGFTSPTTLSVVAGCGAPAEGEKEVDEYERLTLPRALTEGLQELARSHRLTLSNILHGAWALLLGRYTGRDDVVFGVVGSGRPAELAGVEQMIGPFINTLPLRVALDGHEPVLSWLGRLRARQVEMLQYEYSSLLKIQGWSEVPRGSQLFESIFSFQSYPTQPAPAGGGAGLRVEEVRVIHKTHYPLTVAVAHGSALEFEVTYDHRRFERDSIKRLLGHLQVLLEGIVADPGRRVSELPMLGEAERRQILFGWNDTATDYPRGAAVHELFERQAALTPEADAVEFGEGRLSYGELNERANRLARHLRRLGVGAGALVGLCVERSAEMVVGMLAVLKAGGAYLPLDPSYPLERLSLMLEDAQSPVLLTQEHLLGSLPATWAQVVCLDADREVIEREAAENLEGGAGPDDLAYVIYTSGSTGRPKGICIPHRAINRLVRDTDYVQLEARDRVAQASNSSFDAATFEVWGALLNGAALVILPKEVAISPADLTRQLKERGVNTLFLTTALFNQVAREVPDGFAPLKHLLFGGEAVEPRWVAEVLRAGRPERLLHVYGPTEGTTFTTWQLVEDVCAADRTVPIGGPIANTRVHILDAEMNPAPVGVAGEPYVGGEGLAWGYTGRPGQTAERFVPDPFSREPGARLYRTGDVARYLSGGSVEFLGRVDHQVKIRGFRIELGEIEAVLAEHPEVGAAAVTAREDGDGERRLVAYVAAEQGKTVAAAALRSYLKGRLPEYMIPSAFVVLDELPLNPNGKIDRKALPEPERVRPELEGSFKAAGDPVEEMLAGIWAQVLGLETVGADDDFFELGGHSLLATQVVSRVRAAFGVEVALQSLFEQPTVAAFAHEVEAARRTGLGLEAPPVVPVGRDRELPLSFAQQRLWFIDQLEPGAYVYNVPGAFRLEGELNVGALERSFEEIVRRHEALRTSFASVDGRPVQVVAPALDVALPVIDLRHLPEAERETEMMRLALEEARRPFDLSKGPLLRTTLLRLGEKSHLFLLTMHHIVSDGWSVGIILRELHALYEAYASGAEPALPVPAVQYADYAAWQQGWLRGEVLERQLSYWRRQLAGAPPALELPTDFPRPPVQTYRGTHELFALSADVSGQLYALSRREGVTLFMTLLAAYQTLLSRYTGQDDIVVGTDVANRNRAETEDLIGCFINVLVMRGDLSGDPTFLELLGRVRESTLGAYAHQDLPFEKLIEELQPEREPSRPPLFQVAIVLQNTPSTAVEFPGLAVSALTVETEAIKYDLVLEMTETPAGLTGMMHYNADLFEAATVRRMLRHYARLLEAGAAEPRARVWELPLLSETEQRELLVEWNSTAADYARDACVHQLFERRAALTPEAVAVVFGEGRLSYGDLNARSNRLAHYLRRLGVGAGSLVGLCVERSPEMVVGLLATLKAGGAYLPLDPSYPLERLAYMLGDAQVPVLLTTEGLVERLPSHWAHVICLDSDREKVARESEENPEGGAGPDDLAYVIYTSGSTGRPKGVMVEHRGLCNMVAAQISAFRMHEGCRVLQFASFGFDASVSEIFTALLSGASLHVADRESLMPGPALLRLLREREVTTVTLPPSVLAVMPPEDLSALETVIAAGEDCPRETAARWAGGGRRLLNAYGPTEATVCATIAELDGGRVTIGRPIANTEVYILDRHLSPAPVGVYGELHVGGAGLARGYLNRAGLTAERFIANPFGGAGSRLYKTGDLARRLPDGEIEFHGRRDSQFKVRGYRIEAGEIETLLDAHPNVAVSVVVAREDAPGERRLVAYCVPREGEPGAGRDGRERLELWPSVAEFYVYDDLLYHTMTHDELRNQSYRIAIERAVPGKIVLDIGTGSDAILARLCVEAGAERVYAVELLEESYLKAQAMVESLGLSDRIILIHGDSTEVELPEPVDVCVSEIVGPVGGCEGAAQIINNAWRFMKEGGVMIPSRSLTKVAAVELPEEFLEDPGFTGVSARYAEKVFSQVGHRFDLRLCLRNFSTGYVVSDSGTFEDLDFTGRIEPEYEHQIELSIKRDAELSGFVVWLNLYTAEDEVIDILERDYCWLPVYLPVFYPGVEVREGDRIRGTVRGLLSDNGLNLDYTIRGTLQRRHAGDVDFDYTTYHHREVFRATEFHKKVFPGGGINVLQNGEREALTRKLKAYLKEFLPDYMIPSSFMTLDALPLTPHGKVDRRALPAPGGRRAVQAPGANEAGSPVEDVLAGIWAQVLGLETVGADDDFFELGGHSLLATQVASRIQAVFGVEVALRTLFERPTLAAFAREVEGARRAGLGLEAPPMVPVGRDRELPLSFAQQRLWFLYNLEPNSRAYNMRGGIRLEGELNVGALERSFGEIVRRHEALRTSFASVDGRPVQVVALALDVALPVIDLRHLPEAERESRSREMAVAEAERLFDLSRCPLLRLTLLRLGEREHVLVYAMHHIISDGWSMNLFVHEMSVLYEAYASGAEPALPVPAVQYADYAAWQQGWLRGEVLERQLSYWRRQLAGAPPALELPTDFPRPPVQTYRGAHQKFHLPSHLAERLRELSRREGATLFMTLLGAFQVLLARYSGQHDIVVGSDIANRNFKETEPLIGFFINQLVLRTDMSDDPTFVELLGRVRATALDAYVHQDVPFEKVVEAVQPERHLNRSPLFQAKLILQNTPRRRTRSSGLTLSDFEFDVPTATFDLLLSLTEADEGLTGLVEYSTDLFEPATVERLTGNFRTLLEGVAADPGRRVSDLPLLSGAERERILSEWNATGAEYPWGECIHHLFEERAVRTPDAVAVVFEGRRLTYAELNRRANQLAHRLRALGVGPEVLVGLCVERSPEMVVGLLATLKAGGAYLPLDPSYPLERLAYMLGDAQVPVLLTTEGLVERLPSHWAHVICLDPDREEIGRESESNPESGVTAGNLAYAIYTSGSTGKPRAVPVTHGNLLHSTVARNLYYEEPVGGLLLLSSVAFDSSVAGIFWTLTQGGTLVLPREGLQSDLAQLAGLIDENSVSHFIAIPSLWGLFLEQAEEGRLSSLRTVVVAGEVCPKELVRRHQEALPHAALFNEYGPTEATVWSSVYDCRLPTRRGTTPIGRPPANVRLYLLDARTSPVPVGVAGELYVGGEGVARGYLNRPALTAERFVPDPFSGVVGARLYRTGDVARYLADGNIEFLGRLDQQVKVRGYRIELGEVEAALTQHEGVREAAVIVREEAASEKSLAAYLAWEPGGEVSEAGLRAHLAERLPGYMMPATFVVLDSLPRLPNGKVDRRALPAPEEALAGRGQTPFVAPRTPTESALAEVWSQVLGQERVGIDDSFFALGGDSIRSLQVVARAQKLNLHFSIAHIFQHQTIRQLAPVVDGEDNRPEWPLQGSLPAASSERVTGEI